MAISFIYPRFLWLLILVPLVLFLHFYSIKSRKVNALKFSNFEALSRIKGIDLYSKNIVGLVISLLIVFSLVMALSGLSVQRTLASSDSSYIIAIDTSKSMEANDISPSRIDAAKKYASDFIDANGIGSKTGVISFSGSSIIEQQLTSERVESKRAVEELTLSSIGGTDLYDAVITSTNLLYSEESKRVIIISDGQMNIGNLEDAVEYATKNGVIFYTFGIGTELGGETSFGISRIEEDSLRALAYNTGGTYYRIESGEDFRESFDDIITYSIKRVSINLSSYLIIFSIVLFLIYYLLSNTKYRILP